MTGYQSKKKAAQAKVEGPLHVVCQCDKCKKQPAQEPVACSVCSEWEKVCDQHLRYINKLKKKRPWVSLTDEEIKEIVGPWGDTPIKGYTRKLIDQIEAKLKEKNG